MRTIPDTLDSVEEKLRKDVDHWKVSIAQAASLYLQIVEENFSENPKAQWAFTLPLPLVGKVLNSLNQIPAVFAKVKRKVTLNEDMQVTLQFMFQG
jgi:hypothetical protein